MTAQGPMGIIWVCPPPSNSGKWVGYGGQMLLGKGPTQGIPFLFPTKTSQWPPLNLGINWCLSGDDFGQPPFSFINFYHGIYHGATTRIITRWATIIYLCMMISVISMILLYIKKRYLFISVKFLLRPLPPLSSSTKKQSPKKRKNNTSNNTVDGRKPAPPGMYKTL